MSTTPIFNSSLFNPTVERGIQGPTGPTGPQGIQGPPGAATGLSTGADLYPGRVIIQTTGSVATPSLTLPNSLTVGLCSLRGGIGFGINSVERFHIDTLGAHIASGSFGIGTGPVAANSLTIFRSTGSNIVRVSNSVGVNQIAMEAFNPSTNWISFAQQGLFAYSFGMDSSGNVCFSPGTSAPTTGSNSVFITQAKVLNAPLLKTSTMTGANLTVDTMTGGTVNITGDLIVNGMTMHGIYFSGNTTMRGAGSLVMASSPITVPYTCQRVGRQVTITLGATSFSATTSGNIIEVDYGTIISNTGLTLGSVPIARGSYNNADMFMTTSPVILSNTSGFQPAACYITSVGTGVLGNMKIYIVPAPNFVTIGTHWMLGVSFTYTAAEDYA